MKKKLLFILVLFIFPLIVNASNIDSIDINININEDGSANIEENIIIDEVNDEVLKIIVSKLYINNISNYEVFADGNKLIYDNDNKYEMGFYGLNNIDLNSYLWIGNNNYHNIIIKYKIDKMVYNYENNQLLYYSNLLGENKAKIIEITVSSYFNFNDNIKLYGDFYSNNAYIKDNKLHIDIYNSDLNFIIKFLDNKFNIDYENDYKTFISSENEYNIYTSNSTLRYLNIGNNINLYDAIYDDEINAYLNKDGSLDVVEKIKCKAYEQEPWFFKLELLDGSKLDDFEVYVDDVLQDTSKIVDINYYDFMTSVVINIDKSSFDKQVITIKYKMINSIINTSDGQVFYTKLGFGNSNLKTNIIISSYFDFDSNLKVDSFANLINTEITDGKIYATTNTYDLNGYSFLAKFNNNTFNTSYKNNKYNSYNKIYIAIDDEYNDTFSIALGVIIIVLIPIILLISIISANKRYEIFKGYKFKYENGKKINIRNIPYYKETPCDKNIYYVNLLLRINNYNYKKINIMGAIILKWIKNDLVSIEHKKSLFKNTIKLNYKDGSKIIDENEKKLFYFMKSESLAKYNSVDDEIRKKRKKADVYKLYADCIDACEFDILDKMEKEGLIKKHFIKNDLTEYIVSDKLYDESIKLLGLLKYLNNFSRIKDKDSIEVKLWDEYLMFAYLFGNANKTIKELKKMYPDIDNELSTYIDV